ncbi:MAG: bifunctional glycosyltransferase/CDP-glycerol:glycerophosphate glycerophosphotransferase [Nocardioidaceae bacterium]
MSAPGPTPPPLPPLVSVVVPVHNVEEYLDRCLESLRDQSYERLEIIAIDDGSSDRSPDIVARHAGEDPRIHVVRQANAGLGAARNTGLRRASGDYISFVDSDDIVPPDSIRLMVESAETTGSDMVVGAAVRFDEDGRTKPAWAVELHAEARTGIPAADFPEIVRNNYTWNKLFRASFWKRCDLWFREGVSYEDQPIITQLYARASTIDVIPAVTYEWRKRPDKTSISQQTHTLRDLKDRISAWKISREVLYTEAPGLIHDAWLKTLYTTHFHWYLNSRSTVDDDYWRELQQAVAQLTDSTPADVIRQVEPQHRVAVELTRRNMRAELHEFLRVGGYTLANFPAELKPDGLEFRLPTFGDPHVGIPDETYRLHPDQIPLVQRLDSAVWVDEGPLRLAGWAFFRYVDLTDTHSTITLAVEHERTGRVVDVDTSHNPRLSLQPPGDDSWAGYEAGSFTADVPMTEILAGCGPEDGDLWSHSVTVRTGPHERTAVLSRVHHGGSARFLAPQRIQGAILHSLDQQGSTRAFAVRYTVPTVVADELRLQGRQLTGRLRTTSPDPVQGIGFEGLGSSEAQTLGLDPDADGHFSLSLPAVSSTPTSPRPTQPSRWSLRALLSSGRHVPVSAGVGDPAEQHSRSGDSVLTLRQSHRGVVTVQAATGTVVIGTAGVTGRHLEISGHAPAVHDGTLTMALTSPKVSSRPVSVQVRDGEFAVAVPLTYPAWRFGEQILPSSGYTLTVSADLRDGTTVRGPVQVSDDLTGQLPKTYEGDTVAASLTRGRTRSLHVQLMRPVGPEARGRFRRTRLEQSNSDHTDVEELEGLLIETNFGDAAWDSGAAVHHELRRRRADIPVYWTVKDHSVPVPEGGVPVVRNSLEWFRVLRSAKYLIDNMYQPLYHRKPEGQVIITTFHGYPFKQMGLPHWENLQFSRERVSTYLARAREWDYLVSPARYATPLLKRDFGYDGEVLEIGYPRNDVLKSAEGQSIRSATRESLGIADHVSCVLYAPTFRDYLTVDDHLAPMIDFLDADWLAQTLGDDYVLLIRGHAFNRRVPKRYQRSTNLVDVTDYPDPADLCLASDLAVLDYSSLRFDYGVTGKPMLFLVPDLDQYQSTRGLLIDYQPTAPGPLLGSTQELATAIRDLDSVVATYRDAYRRFQEDYLDLEDGKAAARLVDKVFVPRGDAPPGSP